MKILKPGIINLSIKYNLGILIALLYCSLGFAQENNVRKINNLFFTLHNGIRDDSIYDTPEKQVSLIKALGYDGMEINKPSDIPKFKPAMERKGLKIASLYFLIDIDEPHLTEEIKESVLSLKGTGALLCPYFKSLKKTYGASDRSGDGAAVKLLKELSHVAKKAGLKVAVYHHTNFWLESSDHLLNLLKKVNRKNIGMIFNLPHYLAQTDPSDEVNLKPFLKKCMPYLKMVSICGASNMPQEKKTPQNIWTNVIQPLGMGSFNVPDLVRFLVISNNYKGPFILQSWNLAGNKEDNLRNSIKAWWQMKSQLSK